MCGICGAYSLNGRPVDPVLIQSMADTLIHRGPDDAGYFVDGPVGLGHRRLSIIDLASGRQPIFNEDGTKAIVFNGEIYNYRPLRDYLEGKQHRFQTQSDTEVILHLYEEMGSRCVEQLRGMFAFAIWDQSKRTLFLARDRLGVKPLYYALINGRLLFGSELKAIIQDPSVPRTMDYGALDHYFSLLYIPAPLTIFAKIQKLPPAHTLTVTPEATTLSQYWDLRFDPQPEQEINEKALTQQLMDLLTEAVDIRLMSEVPLGAFLSGGIDSSAVVAIMARLMRQQVNTASVGFLEDDFNELPFARKVSERFQTRHHEYLVDPNLVETLQTLSWHFDEPFGDSSAVPTFHVSRMARETVTVALSGDGGDENFAGYRRYYFDNFENRIRRFSPQWLRKPVFGALGKVFPKADWLPRIFRGKTLLTNLSLSPVEGYFNTMVTFNQEMKQQLYTGDYRSALNGHQRTLDFFENHYLRSQARDPLSTIQYVDIKTYLVDDICTKVDRASMANSLEVRNPFLDHKLMEFAATIPWHYKLRGRTGKYILKRSLESTLPREVLHRRKLGFCLPIKRWLRRDLAPYAHERLEELGRESSSFLNVGYIRRLLAEHRSGLYDHSSPLWTLLMLRLWQEKFLVAPPSSRR